MTVMQVDRGEFLAFLTWLDSYYSSEAGLQRPQGLSINGKPDFEGIAAWGFDVYLNARNQGASIDGAHASVVRAIQQTDEWKSKHPAPPFPQAPTEQLLREGRITGQGLTVQTTKYGPMPWWPGCWPWLDAATRAEVAPQLLAHGDEILLIPIPYGPPLYDEPNQFYSADKFGPLDMTNGMTTITPEWVALVEEAIGVFGFQGVWVGIPADANDQLDPNGHHPGYNRAMTLLPLMQQVLEASPKADLNKYVAKILLWDGVFYGFDQPELRSFFESAFALEPSGVYGLEHSTGHIPDGEAVEAWTPAGGMYRCKLLLGEFNDDQFDDSVWQILGRCLPPGTYRRPPEQPAGDDPNPPYHLVNGCTYRVFEYFMYGGVRGVPNSRILAARQKFIDLGADPRLVS